MAPPGYAGYTASPMGMVQLQRVRKLGKAAAILAAASAVAQLPTLAVNASLRDDAQRYLDGLTTDDEFARTLLRQTFAGLLSGGLTLAAAIVTMIWMYRMISNHRALHRVGTWAPGWAIGGWFLPPLVLYVIPFLVFREMWKASSPDVPLDGDWRHQPVSPVTWAWWVMYGLAPAGAFVGSISSGAYSAMFDMSDPQRAQAEVLVGSQTWTWVGVAIGLVAAATYVVLVRGLTARHVRLTGEATRAA